MKIVIGITLVFGTIAMFLWNSVPRLISDVWHARDFVPAQSYTITDYKCTNWNGFMWNECTVTFVSQQSRESRQITDWRFGRAPRDPIQLLQRRDDASSVTTDVSLRTLWNRVLVALTLVLFGVFLTITLVAKAFGTESQAPEQLESEERFRTDDAPMGAPSREPALSPTGRSAFGKRHA